MIANTAMLFPLVIILFTACGPAPKPSPPAPVHLLQCETVTSAIAQSPNADQKGGPCFWRAFRHCTPATLTYVASEQEVHIFTIKQATPCMVTDTLKQGSTSIAPKKTHTFVCSQVQSFRGGYGALTFIGCGEDGNITVPINTAIQ